MKRTTIPLVASLGATLALAAGGASASTMHSALAAHLSGMGDHGIVNLQVTASSGKLCWTFDIPTVKGPTRATIRTGQNGPMLLELGMHYTGIALVTDYDTGVEHDAGVAPVSQEQVFALFEQNLHRVRGLLDDVIPALPAEPQGCDCASAVGPLPS